MFCDYCGREITRAEPAYALANSDIVCEDCYEDHQDEYLADTDDNDPDAYDETESESE